MGWNRNKVGAAVAAAAVVGGGVGAGAVAVTQHSHSASPTVAAVAVTPPSNAASATLSVAELAKQSISGVVGVDSSGISSQSPFPGSSSSTSAEGTGFVYDTAGHIITNEHVIDGASSVRVKFSDGSTA